MERSRGTILGVVAALVVAVISLGIAFAAFNSSLTINGNATVQSSTWDVFLATMPNGTNPGSSAVTLPSVSIFEYGTASSSTTALTSDTFTWTGILQTPGDFLVYSFYVRNTGDYDATLSVSGATWDSSMNGYMGTVTCTQNGVVTQEATNVCNHIKYGVGINNTSLGHGSYRSIDASIILDDGTYTSAWAQDGSDLPTSPVTITATPIVITATQNGSAQ